MRAIAILIITLTIGGLINIEFYSGGAISIKMSLVIMAASLMLSMRESLPPRNYGIILICLAAFYAPYMSLLSYLNFDFEKDYRQNMFGLATNPYVLDRIVVELTAMIGATGALGGVFGIVAEKLSKARNYNQRLVVSNPKNTLGILSFALWVLVGFVLSSLSAPSDTILTAAYTESETPLQNANFSSAWMVSYCIMLFAYGDYRFETMREIRERKGKIFWTFFVYIIVFHQLLRGDRESLTMLVGMVVAEICYIKKSSFKTFFYDNKTVLIAGVAVLLIFANLIGLFRTAMVLVDDISMLWEIFFRLYEEGMFDFARFFQGTWNAVFLTPLSVAGDYLYGVTSTRYGQDYIDLVLSIPPGFVADVFGYERPWSSESNPAWNMTYGIGGWYFLVLPFMNFQLPGVFVLSVVLFAILARVDRNLRHNQCAINFSFYNTVLMAIPHWFWYGEKAIVNALIASYILSYVYRYTSNNNIKEGV